MEIWKDIKGYEGLYQISNLGRVKSLERKIIAFSGSIVYLKEKIISKNSKSVLLHREGLARRKNKSKLLKEHFGIITERKKSKSRKVIEDWDKSNNNKPFTLLDIEIILRSSKKETKDIAIDLKRSRASIIFARCKYKNMEF